MWSDAAFGAWYERYCFRTANTPTPCEVLCGAGWRLPQHAPPQALNVRKRSRVQPYPSRCKGFLFCCRRRSPSIDVVSGRQASQRSSRRFSLHREGKRGFTFCEINSRIAVYAAGFITMSGENVRSALSIRSRRSKSTFGTPATSEHDVRLKSRRFTKRARYLPLHTNYIESHQVKSSIDRSDKCYREAGGTSQHARCTNARSF
jgi:hypothetical protein